MLCTCLLFMFALSLHRKQTLGSNGKVRQSVSQTVCREQVGWFKRFFYKDIRSELRPVSLPAELCAQLSPDARGQLALLLQGSSKNSSCIYESWQRNCPKPSTPSLFSSDLRQRETSISCVWSWEPALGSSCSSSAVLQCSKGASPQLPALTRHPALHLHHVHLFPLPQP